MANTMQSVSAVAKTGLDKYIKARGDGLHVLLADKFAQYVGGGRSVACALFVVVKLIPRANSSAPPFARFLEDFQTHASTQPPDTEKSDKSGKEKKKDGEEKKKKAK